jgi:hypothetical protein
VAGCPVTLTASKDVIYFNVVKKLHDHGQRGLSCGALDLPIDFRESLLQIVVYNLVAA